jgi:ABC-type branched-subunit amino acid transport system substrate-binding protein
MTGSTNKAVVAVSVALTALLVAAGCSSSKSDNGNESKGSPSAGGASTAAGPLKTVTIGVLQDSTGPAASGNKTAIDGVQAGVVYAQRNGFKVKYVIGDTATNPATALAAAQKFVTRDHVDAVIAHSAITFAAAPYLTQHKVPVIGAAEDGPEWITATNMFGVFGALHTTKVADTTGKLFKLLDVQTVGALGYSISPSSSEAAKAAVASAKSQGLKEGYLNAAFPFGSTNVEPVALAMKKANVDGFTAATDPNTAFALITALRNAGADVKAALLATGYGGDVLQAGPGALRAAQNVYFTVGYEPVEMQTAATKQFQADLKSAGVSGVPTYAMYNGYTSVGLLVRALKENGGNADPAAVIASLEKIHDWDALGLWGTHKLDINDRENIVGGADNCTWATKLVGEKFQLVKGADPICGKVLEGVTVSPSS